MWEWVIRLICLSIGGVIGLVVMACCAMARDADQRAEFDTFFDTFFGNIKVRVRWKCPDCGFEQADYVPAARAGLRIEYLAETEVTCSEFLGGCGKSFLIGSQVTPTVEVIQPDPGRILYPVRGE
jgi:hypothetical protein